MLIQLLPTRQKSKVWVLMQNQLLQTLFKNNQDYIYTAFAILALA